MDLSIYQILRPGGSSVSHFSANSYINPLMWGHSYLRRLVSINLTLTLNPLPVDVCRELYISQVAFGGILLGCIQAILMLRGIARLD
jgi:hypothetical protein